MNQCRVYNPQGDLIRTYGAMELQLRNDKILKLGHKKFFNGEDLMIKDCKKCGSEFTTGQAASKFCQNCRRSIPDTDTVIP